MSARAAIEPLSLAFAFDAVEEGETIVFRPRGGRPIAMLIEDDLVIDGERAECRLVRAQETELPVEVSLGFTEVAGDYRRATARSRRFVGASRREARADLAIVASDSVVERAADIWLQDLWAGRERAEFALPPSLIALSPGDVVALEVRGRERLIEIGETVDAGAIGGEGAHDRPGDLSRSRASATVRERTGARRERATGRYRARSADARGGSRTGAPASRGTCLALAGRDGGVALVRRELRTRGIRVDAGGGRHDARPSCARPRRTLGPRKQFRVQLASGALAAQAELAVLNGANAVTIRNAQVEWEVIQFADAELVGERTYRLSTLLRGQLGSEWAVREIVPAGAPLCGLTRRLSHSRVAWIFLGALFPIASAARATTSAAPP